MRRRRRVVAGLGLVLACCLLVYRSRGELQLPLAVPNPSTGDVSSTSPPYASNAAAASAAVAAHSSSRPPVPSSSSSAGAACIEVVISSGVFVPPMQLPAEIRVGGASVVDTTNSGRGMHVVAVDGATGAVMSVRVFDTYRYPGTELAAHIQALPLGTIVLVATADDASYSLGEDGQRALRSIGSQDIGDLNFRGNWVVAGRRGADIADLEKLARAVHKSDWGWGPRAKVAGCLPLHSAGQSDSKGIQMNGNNNSSSNNMRVSFDGPPEARAWLCASAGAANYAALCEAGKEHLIQPIELDWTHGSLRENIATTFPVAIMAGNRPHLLMQLLLSLMAQPGLQPDRVVVFIDGLDADEPRAVAQAFGMRFVQHAKTHSDSSMEQTFKNADMIAAHYRRSLTKLFDLFPAADKVVVLEEDLIAAPDLLRYFSQTAPLLDRDPTLLAVSAWNDNGYEHTAADAAAVYRSHFFPGLGWLLTRRLWEELAPKWPRCCEGWSWDLWLWLPDQRRGRDTLFPDISRTFHAGKRGMNVDEGFYRLYFEKHRLSNVSRVALRGLDRLDETSYNADLRAAVAGAVDITPRLTAELRAGRTCSIDLIAALLPAAPGVASILWYQQAAAEDTGTARKLCTCLRIWDLGDVRGLYHGVLRLHLHGKPLLLAGDQDSAQFGTALAAVSAADL